MRKYLSNVHKMEGAHVQCMSNHYGRFEFEGIKTVVVTDYANQTLPSHFGCKKCLSPTPVKMRKYLTNVHKIAGAHLQYMINHYGKFEYKGINLVVVTDHTNQTLPSHFGWEKCLSPTPVKM